MLLKRKRIPIWFVKPFTGSEIDWIKQSFQDVNEVSHSNCSDTCSKLSMASLWGCVKSEGQSEWVTTEGKTSNSRKHMDFLSHTKWELFYPTTLSFFVSLLPPCFCALTYTSADAHKESLTKQQQWQLISTNFHCGGSEAVKFSVCSVAFFSSGPNTIFLSNAGTRVSCELKICYSWMHGNLI